MTSLHHFLAKKLKKGRQAEKVTKFNKGSEIW